MNGFVPVGGQQENGYKGPFQLPTSATAQYGNVMMTADNAAILRGTGRFNPPPTYEQTTNRGVAYQDALQLYQQTQQATYKAAANDSNPSNPGVRAMDSMVTNVSSLDYDRSLPYVVGNAMHPEAPGSWERPDAGCSRGDNNYIIWATKALNIAPNALLTFLFSVDNVNYIHNRILDEVLKVKGHKISRQSDDQLLTIMLNKYQYAISGWLGSGRDVKPRGPITNPMGQEIGANGEIITFSRAYGNEGPSSLVNQLALLNKAILEEAIKQVFSGIDTYIQYIKDASSLPIPLSHPVLTTMKGGRELSQNIGLESSHEFTKAMDSYNMRNNIL